MEEAQIKATAFQKELGVAESVNCVWLVKDLTTGIPVAC
jgi:hypothetical protein